MAGIFGKALNPGDDFLEQSKFDGVSVNVPPSHRRVGAFAFRHPLEESEAQWQQNEEAVRLKVLRSTQGIQAPLRIKMELKAAEKVGHLPCLSSSRFMTDLLRDESLSFDDILNNQHEFCEVNVEPHLSLSSK